jgi:hypothetical protein
MDEDPPPDPLLSDELDAVNRSTLSRARRAAVEGSTWRTRLKHWTLGAPPAAPLPALLAVLDEPKPGRYGICCSGGGIRSAAFNLGALQVLQDDEHRVLQRASYLSAVSGGSYMAAGFAMVADTKGPDGSDPLLVTPENPPFCQGSPEEQYLRNRSSYMAPGLAGKGQLLARVALGITLNLLFLGSILFVSGWLLGWLIYGELLYPGLRDGDAATTTASLVSLGLLGITAVVGITSVVVRSSALTRVLDAWTGRLLVLTVVVALMLVAVPALIEWLSDDDAETTAETVGGPAAAAGGAGTLALLASILLQLRARMADSRLVTHAVKSGRKGLSAYFSERILPRVRSTLVAIATTLAGPLLLGGILFVSALAGVLEGSPAATTLIALAAAVALFAALCWFGDVNSWSLHSFYRRRLASAFALKRVCGDTGAPVAPERECRCGDDDDAPRGRPIAVERDFKVPILLSSSAVEAEGEDRVWPQLVVCAAANVSDPGATPPGRAVTSFTFSPRAMGGPLIGTVWTKRFEKAARHRLSDFTLPAAVAMSGAALAPSMGKQTRAALRFLLTLGNARLGVWVPNPLRLDPESETFPFRRPSPLLLIRELLGVNSADAKYLYVTDGGHYENLGLVELLRRGCRDVYCFDASGGSDIQELGDAIALARTELKVEVTLERAKAESVVPDKDTGIAQECCVTGEIRYPDGELGTLVYVRSVLTAEAPHDVRSYHEVDPEFPHNSTGEQLYTDQRFEAYRELGRCAAARALEAFKPPVTRS